MSRSVHSVVGSVGSSCTKISLTIQYIFAFTHPMTGRPHRLAAARTLHVIAVRNCPFAAAADAGADPPQHRRCRRSGCPQSRQRRPKHDCCIVSPLGKSALCSNQRESQPPVGMSGPTRAERLRIENRRLEIYQVFVSIFVTFQRWRQGFRALARPPRADNLFDRIY